VPMSQPIYYTMPPWCAPLISNRFLLKQNAFDQGNREFTRADNTQKRIYRPPWTSSVTCWANLRWATRDSGLFCTEKGIWEKWSEIKISLIQSLIYRLFLHNRRDLVCWTKSEEFQQLFHLRVLDSHKELIELVRWRLRWCNPYGVASRFTQLGPGFVRDERDC
jgi:hypothetical protein